MPRSVLTPVELSGPYALTPSTITWAAADVANGNRFLSTGREILLVRNQHGTVAKTVTVDSVAKDGRTGDLTQSVTALQARATQMFPTAGWQQADGYIYVDGESADVEFIVLRVP